MATSTRPKRSLVGIELVRLLAYEGDRIFTTDRARELAPRIGLKEAYVAESLHHLRKGNWIVSLRRGLYALSPTVPGVAAAHEFEIAMSLVDPAMISHWSALHHHGLTEQVPRDVFVLTTKGTWIPRSRGGRSSGGYAVGDATYQSVTASLETRGSGSAMPAFPSQTWSAHCLTVPQCRSTAAISPRCHTPFEREWTD